MTNHRETLYGKGDCRRPENNEAFRANYDAIFAGEKPEIVLQRFAYHPSGTLGVLTLGDLRLFSIERPWLNNERNESCIPEGEYDLVWQQSPRFGMCYEVVNVPERSRILFHVANYASDVEGCIGLGLSLMEDRVAVASSRNAIKKFHAKTDKARCRLTVGFAPLAAMKSL